jgi:uroporphyrinogen III methyltransferase/synthase
MNGTRPSQRVVEAPLGELPARVAAAGLGPPAVVVVGDVVRLRSELAWFEALPLFGRRVLVTRTPEQADSLVRALEEAGAEPVLAPTIRVAAAPRTPALDSVVAALPSYDLLVFTSANAVRALEALVHATGSAPNALAARAHCVGPATRAAARAAGFAVAELPTAPADAGALLAALRSGVPVAGRRVLWPRGAAAGPALANGLREAGAWVDAPVVYRTEPAPFAAAELARALAAGELHALTFASPSAARSFASGMGESGRAAARSAVIAAIGRVTADALTELGLPPDAVAERPEPEALVAALASAFTRRKEEA